MTTTVLNVNILLQIINRELQAGNNLLQELSGLETQLTQIGKNTSRIAENSAIAELNAIAERRENDVNMFWQKYPRW